MPGAVMISSLLVPEATMGHTWASIPTTKSITTGRSLISFAFSMVWMLIAANIVGAGLLMAWSRQVARASFIDGHLIVPGVLLFVLMGAWLQSPDFASWLCLLALHLGRIEAGGLLTLSFRDASLIAAVISASSSSSSSGLRPTRLTSS
jgi:hypothetical protein